MDNLITLLSDTEYVFTDGSGHGTSAAYFYKTQCLMFTKNKTPTNIRSEGMAIIIAMVRIKKIIRDGTTFKKFHIVTDSQFWIDMLYKYIPSWIKKKENIEKKANPDIVVGIWKLYNELHEYVNFEHIYSHDKRKQNNKIYTLCNDLVDKVCTILATLLKDNHLYCADLFELDDVMVKSKISTSLLKEELERLLY